MLTFTCSLGHALKVLSVDFARVAVLFLIFWVVISIDSGFIGPENGGRLHWRVALLHLAIGGPILALALCVYNEPPSAICRDS